MCQMRSPTRLIVRRRPSFGKAMTLSVVKIPLPALLALAVVSLRAPCQAQRHAMAGYGEEREFTGTFVDNSQESIFFPCGIRLADDGWWVRFQPGVEADRVRYQYSRPGFPTSTHDIRVRGRLSPPGRFGTGFHTRELVVNKLLDVKDPRQICTSYLSKPAKWKGGGPVHVGVRSAVASNDGSLVAILDWLGEMTVWSTSAGESLKHFPSGQTWRRDDGTPLPLAFSPGNNLLAAAGSDGFARVWSLSDGRLLWRLRHSVG